MAASAALIPLASDAGVMPANCAMVYVTVDAPASVVPAPEEHAATFAIVTGAVGGGGDGAGCALQGGALTSESSATSSAAKAGATPALRRRQAVLQPAPRSRGAERVTRALMSAGRSGGFDV